MLSERLEEDKMADGNSTLLFVLVSLGVSSQEGVERAARVLYEDAKAKADPNTPVTVKLRVDGFEPVTISDDPMRVV